MAINEKRDVAPPGRYHRFRASFRRNPVLDLTWRAGVLVVGLAVLAAGVAMMVLPGPGILGIILGLGILATEFSWARTALVKAKAAAERARQKARDRRARKQDRP
jgi:uncharacterized protein (TIGR02611 family)